MKATIKFEADMTPREAQIARFMVAEGRRFLDCSRCNNDRIDVGGWMGPTKEAPYPRPCPRCSPDMTDRELQQAYAAYLYRAPQAIRERGIAALDA